VNFEGLKDLNPGFEKALNGYKDGTEERTHRP
jgi:hypothetical protein